MTPDLPTRVREAFEEVMHAPRPDHSEWVDDALAAVIAVVQEDRTREIVEWAMRNAADRWESTANAITREFGGTTHD